LSWTWNDSTQVVQDLRQPARESSSYFKKLCVLFVRILVLVKKAGSSFMQTARSVS